MKYIFLVNPAAGKGRSDKELLPEVHPFLKARGLDYEIHRTLSEGDIISYVRQRAAGGEPVRFVACGGDGTLNNTLRGMMGFPNAELAVMPYGSGNDFVRNFTNKEAFLDLEKQLNGRVEQIDVIKANDSYGINMFNIGADCEIAADAGEVAQKSIFKGSAAYMVSALKILSKTPSYRMRYAFDGEEPVEGQFLLCAVANGHFCGGGFQSSPLAKLDDGKMDVCIVNPVKGPTLIRLLAAYHEGKHLADKEADKYIRYVQCSRFSLAPLDPMRVCTDGEISQFADTTFESVPKAVKFVVPQGCQPL